MQMVPATQPPAWLSPWPGVVLYEAPSTKALEYYRALARERARQRSRLTFYAYGHDDKVLRIGGWGAGAAAAGAGGAGRPPPGWERYPVESPFDRYPLRQLAAAHLDHLAASAAAAAASGSTKEVPWGSGAGGGAGAGAFDGSLRTWVVCSALVAAALMVVRAVDHCLRRRLGHSRRAEEWPTPNVWATSQPGADDTVIIPGLEGAEPLPANPGDVTTDLPPPYSECTGPGPSSDANKPTEHLLYEDPPPAYSYVEFSNKNGIPSVLIFSRRRTPLADRRDIAAAESGNNDETTADQNSENTNIEMTNGAARELESIEITNSIDTSRNNETMNTDMSGSNAIYSVTSTCETTVDIDEDENTLKGGVVIV